MQIRWKTMCLLIAASAAFMLGGCGKDGKDGATGKDASTVVKVSSLTTEQWAALAPKGEVLSVSINSAPVVKFKVTDANGNPLVGLGNMTKSATATVASYPNVAFSLAKLVPGTNSPSKWVSYIVTTVPTTTTAATGTRPSTDNTGTLVDNGDGTYQYTFYRDITKIKDQVAAMTFTAPNAAADLGDLTYDPNLTHRLAIQISGAARGTGSNTADASNSGVTSVNIADPANIIYDFVPATGKAAAATAKREIVTTENCNGCHGRLNGLGFHGGARNDVRYCMVCHTDQRKFGRTEAAAGTVTTYNNSTYRVNNIASGDMPNFIHQLHMGNELSKTGYNYGGLQYDKIGYSMLGGGIKNCRKCHNGDDATKLAAAPQANNWKDVPSRLACGSCHDAVNFATGTGHVGGSASSDANCALCHKGADVERYHVTDNATANNPSVPTGATNFTYDISTATVASNNDLTIKFRILAQTPPATTATPVTFVAPAATVSNALSGFTGAPAFLLAYTLPQDGITTPADFNNLGKSAAQPASISIATLLSTNSAATGSMTGPDASGYYTATIKSASAFPAGAKMRTVALQGYFTQVSPALARHTLSVVKTVTGDTVRRSVIDPAKCGSCHEWFEGHGGNRNIGAGTTGIAVCTVCHVPNLSSSGRTSTAAAAAAMNATEKILLAANGYDINNPLGWPEDTNNLKDMVHGWHAGKDRVSPLTFIRFRSGTAYYFNVGPTNTGNALTTTIGVGFPNELKNCLACHLPGTYSSVPTTALVTTNVTDNATSPKTTASITAARASVPNANYDIITTPFTAACVTCHDSAAAQAHMTLNGGKIKQLRTADNLVGESCAACHSAGKEFDPVKVHK